jgi:hypothetical protein
MQAIAIGFRVHRDGFDAQILAGADDPHSNLAPVGDQYLLKHISAAGW